MMQSMHSPDLGDSLLALGARCSCPRPPLAGDIHWMPINLHRPRGGRSFLTPLPKHHKHLGFLDIGMLEHPRPELTCSSISHQPQCCNIKISLNFRSGEPKGKPASSNMCVTKPLAATKYRTAHLTFLKLPTAQRGFSFSFVVSFLL
ncbi:hypothetical protein TWF173_009196 [Orbilia oligospora]|nr:hypothetical protein TWF173_009196 [Orbilia oligospora]